MTKSQELPVGTVTMLFSDIEGSTALLLRLGDRYAEALSAHRVLLRDAFRAGGGRELGTEGDSFFVVFASATAAVRSCVVAQRALADHAWPGGATVRVRMGLHSGEPDRHEDGYVGIAVHRAARIASTAHGGQVVLSDVTRQLMMDSQALKDVELRDLGWHRLKDIEGPEHLFQLVASGLDERFPALRSLGAETRLPLPLTPLVGRDGDLERLCASVLQPDIRLVTLTGTGGVGKSRLALAAASSLGASFRDGVFFCALAAINDTEGMWQTIADGLGLARDQSASDAAVEHLKGREALLVLDNLEQISGAVDAVSRLLAGGPSLVIIGTSRRPLHLQGEHEQPVAPLDLPGEGSVDVVAASSAAQLFVQQADMAKPGFAVTPGNAAAIGAICRRLDGIPLAIELAASRARLLGPNALLARLGDGLGLNASESGRPSRQQTVRSTVAWSCGLLTPALEVMFRRIGVFAGGCDLDALTAVADPDQAHWSSGLDSLQPIADLLDISLITISDGIDGEPRVGMLQTIRQYAMERLEESGDLEPTRRRHAEYFASIAEQASQQLNGSAQLAGLDRFETEHDNLRAAMTWAFEGSTAGLDDTTNRAAIGLRLVGAMAPFWYQHGHATEGRQWLERAMVLVSDAAGAPLGRLAHWLGVLLQQQGRNDLAISFFERSLMVWRDLDDRDQMARVLNSLGITHAHLGDASTARSFLDDSIVLARGLGSDARLATALSSLGNVESLDGNVGRASELLQEALTLDRAQGDSMGVAIDQHGLALVSLRAGQAGEAHRILSGSIDYVVSSGDVEFLADSLELFAAIAAAQEDGLRAARLFGTARGVRQRAGMPIAASDAAVLERYLAPARETLAPDRWETQVAAGAALTDSQAFALVETTAQGSG